MSHKKPKPPKRRSPAAASLAERQFSPKVIPNKAKVLPRKAKHRSQPE